MYTYEISDEMIPLRMELNLESHVMTCILILVSWYEYDGLDSLLQTVNR